MTDELYLAVLYHRIRNARQTTSLTQSDVAEHLGITLREYQRFESSTSRRIIRPDVIQIRHLAKLFQVDLGQFLREPTEEEVRQATASRRKPGRPRKKEPSGT